MSHVEIDNPLNGQKVRIGRLLGQHTQDRSGPLLIVLAGIHGNEPSGIHGFQHVLRRLQADDPPFFGHLLGIAGNLPALAAGQRFIDEDLNRIWLDERIGPLASGREPRSSEERELREIFEVIENHRRGDDRKNFFIDCHTTSCESIPYISVPKDVHSVQLAAEFPVHTVVGGGDLLVGVSDRCLIDRGFRGFTFEAGQHYRLASIEAQQAAIWVALHRMGCITEIPASAESTLACTMIDGHKFFEFEYVHTITPETGFRMKPGYYNFQRIHEGDLLGWEREHPIVSQWDARIFLPLYQPTGDDGFSIIRQAERPSPAGRG